MSCYEQMRRTRPMNNSAVQIAGALFGLLVRDHQFRGCIFFNKIGTHQQCESARLVEPDVARSNLPYHTLQRIRHIIVLR
jgi:hypothetical protein